MTRKQKASIKKILENPGVAVSKIMEEVGYSPNTAHNPSDLTNSKGWKLGMDEHWPDERLLQLGEDAFDATKTSNAAILLTQDGQLVKAEEQGLIETPDWFARHKYWHDILSMKGYLKPDGATFTDNSRTIVLPYFGESDPFKRQSDALYGSDINASGEIPGPQLAPQGPKDNTSNIPVSTVGG